METTEVQRDAENELPVPFAWRKTLELIASAFSAPSPLKALSEIKNVSFDSGIIEISRGQIEDYPASHAYVGPMTWNRSIYLWQGGYWSVLVDLHIDDDRTEVSDLVLPVKVSLVYGELHFEPNFVHVP